MLVDILQRANNVIQRSECDKLEKAYEQAYLQAVKYRNDHPRASWTRQNRTEYNDLLIAIDIARTDLAQFLSLRNTDSDILYSRR